MTFFYPSDSCYGKTVNAHDLNLMFNYTINSDNTSINDTDNIISEENDPFTINSNTQYVTTNLVKKSLIHDSGSHFNFTAISVNIRSLNNYKNFAKLKSLLSALTFKPSIIAVTETWLKPDQLEPTPISPIILFSQTLDQNTVKVSLHSTLERTLSTLTA